MSVVRYGNFDGVLRSSATAILVASLTVLPMTRSQAANTSYSPQHAVVEQAQRTSASSTLGSRTQGMAISIAPSAAFLGSAPPRQASGDRFVVRSTDNFDEFTPLASLLDSGEPFPLIAADQPIGPLLSAIGVTLGVAINVDAAVDGGVRVTEHDRNLTARQFLDSVTRQARLVWYYDGFVLHLAPESSIEVRMVALNGVPFEELRRTIKQLGLGDTRFPLRTAANAPIVMVQGPPAFTRTVERIVKSLGGAKDGERDGSADSLASVSSRTIVRGPAQ